MRRFARRRLAWRPGSTTGARVSLSRRRSRRVRPILRRLALAPTRCAPNWAMQAWVRTRAGFCWDRYVDDAPRETYWDEPDTELTLVPSFGGLGVRLTF